MNLRETLSCRDVYQRLNELGLKWYLPFAENLARQSLVEIAHFGICSRKRDDFDLEWGLAVSFVDTLLLEHKTSLEPFIDIFEKRLSIEKTAVWVDRYVTALEVFGSHGRNASNIGQVYFLRGGEFIKIGYTAGPPELRARELSTGCPFPVTLMGVRKCTRATETWLHQIFSEQRANLEWFHATDLLIRSAEILIENGDEPLEGCRSSAEKSA